ncbi:Arrestin homolog [Eumeta japonica]|uniref:Arrestin homolog n=1 Tax=Eumeta variegata TaxID=151549 RepID=A0A4C2A7M8_EUMVA|nr:Arrestin homolog [Eumeta japonica]
MCIHETAKYFKVELEAWLDKATYSHGESISVSVVVANHSSKTVRRIKALIVQHVDVCMFSNGKFKNVVALVRGDPAPVPPGHTLTDTYTLTPHRGGCSNGAESLNTTTTFESIEEVCGTATLAHNRGLSYSRDKRSGKPSESRWSPLLMDTCNPREVTSARGLLEKKQDIYRRRSDRWKEVKGVGVTKNWIALEDSYSKTGASLASTVVCNSNSPEDRNVFAIYVSYYVKVKLTLSAMGGDVSVKLPFILTHSCINEAPTDSVIEEATHKMILEGKENSVDEEDDKEDLTKDKQNNNGAENPAETAEVKPSEEHCCVADVLVNIENKMTGRPKNNEGITQTEVRDLRPNEELDLIVKYPGSDT